MRVGRPRCADARRCRWSRRRRLLLLDLGDDRRRSPMTNRRRVRPWHPRLELAANGASMNGLSACTAASARGGENRCRAPSSRRLDRPAISSAGAVRLRCASGVPPPPRPRAALLDHASMTASASAMEACISLRCSLRLLQRRYLRLREVVECAAQIFAAVAASGVLVSPPPPRRRPPRCWIASCASHASVFAARRAKNLSATAPPQRAPRRRPRGELRGGSLGGGELRSRLGGHLSAWAPASRSFGGVEEEPEFLHAALMVFAL